MDDKGRRENLNDATERLNSILDRAEEKFQRLNFGVTAFVVLPESGELHFRKMHDKGFILVVIDGGDPVQVKFASRKTRVEAAGALDALWEALRLEAERQILIIDEAVTKAERWVKE